MDAHLKDCVCAYCKDRKPFTAPPHLLQKIAAGEVVLFAGAGISTENKTYCRSTLYEEVRSEIKLAGDPSFPELMDTFCDQPDGRIKLLEKIKKRFDYFSSFESFHRNMTQFHRSISPLFMITDVVTTNWDDFFERECSFDAFVYDSDLAFWDAAKRRVMKIHGSITNFGSIVATKDDYRQSFNRLNNGPLGAQLKSLIARKTVIYVGYSLSDDNYLKLLSNIAKMMGRNVRQSYLIAPDIDSNKLSKAPIPLHPIETDGTYFFEEVRKQLETRCNITRDEGFQACFRLFLKVTKTHDETASAFLRTQHPLLIFALSYQDGLLHALQRIARMRRTGEYHSIERVHSQAHAYEHILNDFRKRDDYWNAAYALGYQTGLIFLLLKSEDDEVLPPPLFSFPFNVGASSLSAILRFPKSKVPKRALAQANRMLKRFPKEAGLIPDHTPYL